MTVNVYESGGNLVIEAAVPGAGPDDVDIQCAEGVLTIRARTEVPEHEFLHQEIRPVEYVRQLALPADCRFDEAKAEADNGILTIRIPKTQPRAPEKIRIQVARRGGDTRTIDAKPGLRLRHPGGRIEALAAVAHDHFLSKGPDA